MLEYRDLVQNYATIASC